MQLLNKQQQQAVEHISGPLCLIAGAGSGKTRVLTTRFVELVNNKVDDDKILCLTFTNKAAKEMRDRIYIQNSRINSPWILTYHAFANKILRSEIKALGFDEDFVIIDSKDKKKILRDLIKLSLKLDVSTFDLDDLVKKFKPKEYIEDNNIINTQLYAEYLKYCKDNSLLEFDDLLYYVYQVFKQEEHVLKYYRNIFTHIMVDEFQDTNNIQFKIIELLAEEHKNIMVVGDEDQSIYSFRGAISPKNFNDFISVFNPKIIKLETNYRSTKNILDFANKSISNNKDRHVKVLNTINEVGSEVTVKRFNTDTEELSYVMKNIDYLLASGVSSDSISIIYRNNNLANNLERSLKSRNIDYKIHGSTAFFEREEIKDIISYLRLFTGVKSLFDYLRIVNVPKRGIGSKTQDLLYSWSTDYGYVNSERFDEILENDEDVLKTWLNLKDKQLNNLMNFNNLITSMKNIINEISLDRMFDIFLDTTNYYSKYESNQVELSIRKNNILALKNMIVKDSPKDFKNNSAYLKSFIYNVTLDSDISNENKSAIKLMTMHSSKGLEFDIVFIVGTEENIIPSTQSRKNDNLEEERRLFYVAITRAKKKLFITSAKERYIYGETKRFSESSFISEVNYNELQRTYNF